MVKISNYEVPFSVFSILLPPISWIQIFSAANILDPDFVSSFFWHKTIHIWSLCCDAMCSYQCKNMLLPSSHTMCRWRQYVPQKHCYPPIDRCMCARVLILCLSLVLLTKCDFVGYGMHVLSRGWLFLSNNYIIFL
jgi:hypothetical protein